MVAEIAPRTAGDGRANHLCTLLARTLLAYTLDFERGSAVSLPLWANFLRVLADGGLDVRELPSRAGVSKEATSMALRYLTKAGHVDVREKLVELTPKGGEAELAARRVHADPTGRLPAYPMVLHRGGWPDGS
jgi:hypothetical protein